MTTLTDLRARVCINLLPFITLWVIGEGEDVP